MTNRPTWRPHPAQQGMLAQDQEKPANCTLAYIARGNLDPQRLAEAYRSAASGFDALRLVMQRRAAEPIWAIGPHVRVEVHVVAGMSMASLAVSARERAAVLLRPDAGPLGVVHIQPCGPDEWLITEVFSHLIADGRALAILHDRVAAHYAGGRNDQAPGSYRQLLQDATAAADQRTLAFWRRWYAGFEPVRLPLDPDAAGERRGVLQLGPDQVRQVSERAGRCRATLATALLGAHAHAVARHIGTGDISTYLAADARPAEHSDVFGQVTVLAPIRIVHAWADTAASQVQQLSRHLLQVRPHLAAALDDLDQIGAIQPLGSPSATAFIFQDRPATPPELTGVAVTPVDLPDQHHAGGLVTVVHRNENGGLTMQVRTPAGSGLHRHLDSIVVTIARFLDTFVADPGQRLGSDAFLPTAAAELVGHVAEPTPPYPYAPVAHQIIADLGGSDRVVLVEGGIEYRSRELLAAVQERAAALNDAGVRARHGVIVDENTALGRIAALLAVLYLGAVYVPVTADLPDAMRKEIRSRSRPDATLTEGHVARTEHWADRAPEPLSATAPAYVIFTSGSTGQPKGVVVAHASLANLASGEADRFGFRPGDRVLLIAPPTTDPWICHVTGALLAGAALVAVDLRADVALAVQMAACQVTHAFLPAAIFADLAVDATPTLRMIASAGDRCRPAALAAYLDRPGMRVFNVYGPTEATVTATVAQITRPEDPVPIGTPIRGLGARVVIDRAATAPPGVAGELVLSGAGLAVGYLDDPAATQQQFGEDPFRPGHRWYATGDRAWLGTNGLLYVNGRLDRQVKIRGFRVEPGHVEATARASGLCQDAHAIVLAPPGQQADGQLRLYVTGCPSPDQLLAALRTTLPPHLVPAAVIDVDQIPRTIACKIDEQALALTVGADARDSVGEQTPAATAWRRVLGVAPQPADDFFALGGDSLQVLRLVRELRLAGIDVNPSDVYQRRTFAALTSTGAGRALPVPQVASDLSDATATRVAPLGPSQRWFFELGLIDPRRWNQHHRVVFNRLPSANDLAQAVAELLRTAPILTAAITPAGVHYRTEAPPDVEVPVHSAPLADGDLADIVERLHDGMDPSKGRTVRAAAIRQSDGSGVLLLAAHHLVIDDWSWRLIEDRIRAALAEPGRQLPVDDGYRTFAAAVDREHAAGAFTLDTVVWRQMLATATTDWAHRPTTLCRTCLDIAGDPTAIAARWGVPLAAVLLACLGHALARGRAGKQTLVDLERNGRSALRDVDLSESVGWLALHHPLPIRHTPISAASARDLAAQLEAIPDDGLSYGALRWSGADLGTGIARFAVNIAGEAPAPALLAVADLLDQLERCPVPSAAANNRLPYTGSLVFRRAATGFRAELTFDPQRLPNGDAEALLNSLADALNHAEPAKRPLDRHRAARPFDAPIPASAMQRLMLHRAGAGPGVYLPRQVIALPNVRGEPDDILGALAVMLGQLDPFRRRFARSGDTIVQYVQPPSPLPIRRTIGALEDARRWLNAPDELDPTAACDGAPLAVLTAFIGGDELLVGMQLHHAIMDGQSNVRLATLLDESLQRLRTGAPVRVPADLSRSGLATRKHVSAEIAAAASVGAAPAVEAAQLATCGQECATLSATDISRLAVRAQGLGVDVRAMFGAAALALAREHHEGQPVYLVANGRTPDIPDTMHALGMFWYLDPQQPRSGNLDTLARQVFQAARAPLRHLRTRAVGDWPNWTTAEGMSFNYLKTRPSTVERSRLRTIGSRDRFHLPHQIEVVHNRAGTLDLRWLTMSRRPNSRPRLAEYLALLDSQADIERDEPCRRQQPTSGTTT